METLKEMILYGFGGLLTTIVNYLVYFLLPGNYLIRNSLAWIVAVLFSYGINQRFVFRVKGNLFSFIRLRFITLLIENALLFVCIQVVSFQEGLSKILVSIFVVVSNYLFCRKKIFKEVDPSWIN